MRIRDYALMIAQEKLFFTWMFVPETRSLRVWTTLKDDKRTVVDVRDIPEDYLEGDKARDYLAMYLEKKDDKIQRKED